ncbi:hypothetical protein DFH08DRAFT_251570 [Mycena albidolilacea]|uniref:Uncharacterized protein n=1 Tax=Mycena albidolilacea TaxID=1033008 RepID=A0AAD7ENE0_9AGAR|nr:hypothetical protein DFH08DRAFT_251570 [Mycena albidolilacea]
MTRSLSRPSGIRSSCTPTTSLPINGTTQPHARRRALPLPPQLPRRLEILRPGLPSVGGHCPILPLPRPKNHIQQAPKHMGSPPRGAHLLFFYASGPAHPHALHPYPGDPGNPLRDPRLPLYTGHQYSVRMLRRPPRVRRTCSPGGASAFPNLTTLRLYLPPWVPAPIRLALTEQLFAGLAGPASVKKPPKSHTLILAWLSDTDSALYAVLDEVLCALELQLELEVDAATYAFILTFFLRLEASGAVSRTEGGVHWWYVGREGVW